MEKTEAAAAKSVWQIRRIAHRRDFQLRGQRLSGSVRGRLRGEAFTGAAFRVDFGDLGDVDGAIGETSTRISNEILALLFQGFSPVLVPSKVPNVPQVYPLANGSASGDVSGSSDTTP